MFIPFQKKKLTLRDETPLCGPVPCLALQLWRENSGSPAGGAHLFWSAHLPALGSQSLPGHQFGLRLLNQCHNAFPLPVSICSHTGLFIVCSLTPPHSCYCSLCPETDKEAPSQAWSISLVLRSSFPTSYNPHMPLITGVNLCSMNIDCFPSVPLGCIQSPAGPPTPAQFSCNFSFSVIFIMVS